MYTEIKNLCKQVNHTQVFRNFSFSANKGESIAVSGENGSVLLQLLAGRIPPDSGSITVGGVTAGKNRKSVLLPKSPRLIPHMTLSENLCLPLYLRGFSLKDAADIAAEQLRLFGLESFLEFYPCQLNSGVLKRAAIAEMGLFDADMLLLDEPFFGIDERYKGQIYGYLNGRRLEGCGLFIASRNEKELEYLTERTLDTEKSAVAALG